MPSMRLLEQHRFHPRVPRCYLGVLIVSSRHLVENEVNQTEYLVYLVYHHMRVHEVVAIQNNQSPYHIY